MMQIMWPLMRRVMCVVIAMLAAAGAEAVTKRAVVIGIGTYADSKWNRIHGDNDAQIVGAMLRSCGYSDIKTLTNSGATKAKITRSFAALLNRCAPGDIVYIHFSGHGQQITDVDGDEPDGLDEAWIPYDARKQYSSSYKGENHLVDDEIAVWMTKIKKKIGSGGRLLVVVDSCHSGDSLRDGADDDTCYRGAYSTFVIPMKSRPRHKSKAVETWLTLTACRDIERNAEIKTDKGFYGSLTLALYRQYRRMADADNSAVMTTLRKFIRGNVKYPQEPTLTGDRNSHILSQFFK